MQRDFEQRITTERERLKALDATLDVTRTPYLKGQLRFASHMLDDATSATGHAEKAEPRYSSMWSGLAEMNVRMAQEIRQKVAATVEAYGGPEHVTEIGG